WFYKALGGIKPDPDSPGFKNVLLQPNFVAGLDHFEASHESPYGTINSSWKRAGKKISYQITIPANSTATLLLPKIKGRKLYEDGKVLKKSSEFVVLSDVEDGQMLELQSGTYLFEMK